MVLPAPGDDRAAVITGASSGIGEAMARELAGRGHQVVLVARNADRLHALAQDLGAHRAHVLPADLSRPADRAALPGRVAELGLVADVLINNAAFSIRAPVAQSVPEQQLNLLEVDVAAVVDLCSRFVPGMVERGRGAVLNVASVAGFGPLPVQATYGGAKAFVLSYTESLRGELRGTGVTVTTLCPGPVATGFDQASGFRRGERRAALPGVMWKSPEKVARAGIDGLAADKGRVIPGWANRLLSEFYRFAPHEPLLPLIAERTPTSARGSRTLSMLEVIDKGSVSEAHPVPLLFVHGVWHAAWCWDEHFLGYFADKGYRAVALSFRGHGNSQADKPLRSCSAADYVADVSAVADSLPTPPVIIGHSMGGLVVQKYLESHDAPAAVLLTSVPPQGNLGNGLRWFKRRPWDFVRFTITGKALPYISAPHLARERFFSPHTPESDVVKYAARLQEDSSRIGIDSLFLKLPHPERVVAPLLVLGAAEDGAHTRQEVEATARAYGTEAEFFPDMGHNMMLEPGWEAVAERIHDWLATRGL